MKKLKFVFARLALVPAFFLFVFHAYGQPPKDPCNFLCNGSFQQISPGWVPGPAGYNQIPASNVPCWRSSEGWQRIEIWADGANNISRFSGSYFAELSCTTRGTLSQSFSITSAQAVVVSFAHRGRYSGYDSMRVSIVPTTPPGPPINLGIYRDNNSAWKYYTTSVVNLTPGVYDVNFAAISSNDNRGPLDGGNLLDSVSVHCPVLATNPCCPPWTVPMMPDVLSYSSPGGTSANYTMSFAPSALFKNQMQGYVNYLHSINYAITDITLHWSLNDQGTGTLPSAGYGPQIGSNYYVTWTWNLSGTGAPLIPLFFPGYPLQVNRWYCIHTGIYLNSLIRYFPASCDVNNLFVRVRVERDKRQLQFSDGASIIKTMEVR